MIISREFGFDMGHCLPDHQGGCYRPHGHRYRLDVSLTDDVIVESGNPENGMLMDYQRLKQIVTTHVIDLLDHRFMVAGEDPRVVGLLDTFGADALVVSSGPPTAEYIVDAIATLLLGAGLDTLTRLDLWETPTCRATWMR